MLKNIVPRHMKNRANRVHNRDRTV